MFIKRFLGEDVSALDTDKLTAKYTEAEVMREFEVALMQEAISKAFGGK